MYTAHGTSLPGRPIIVSLVLFSWSPFVVAQPPQGFEIVNVVRDLNSTEPPRVNKCGQVVLPYVPAGEYDSEIFLYDNGILLQVTHDDSSDYGPDINDAGTIVWAREVGLPNRQVVLYRDRAERVLGPGRSPRINNLDHVVWKRMTFQGCQNSDYEIDYFDGNTVAQLTEGGRSNQEPQINDSNEIVWKAFNFCNTPWTSDIMFYRDGASVPMPTVGSAPQSPAINNNTQVAWDEPEGIMLWEEGEVTEITNWGINPSINNKGDIHFLRWHEAESTWHGWLYAHTGVFYQITNDSVRNTDGDINDAGEVAWRWSYSPTGEWGVRFMRRIRTGDGDLDGDIDLDDYAMFVNCVTGPEWVELTDPGPEDSLCECRFMDIDHDGDVDFHDFRLFQLNIGGEGR